MGIIFSTEVVDDTTLVSGFEHTLAYTMPTAIWGVGTMTDPLRASELSRFYGRFQALLPTDLTLQAGEIAVLSGPNGPGRPRCCCA